MLSCTCSTSSSLPSLIFVPWRILVTELNLTVLGNTGHVSCELELFRSCLLVQKIKSKTAASARKEKSGQTCSVAPNA